MPPPARNTIAVIGAGPIGLEAALAAIDHGFDVHVFEQGEVGSHPLAWGHVPMFTPWRMNVGPVSRTHLERAGWTMPEAGDLPTGREYVERYLTPLAKMPAFEKRIHRFAQVVHVSRRGALKGDRPGGAERRDHPFRLLVRDQGGRESFLHAFAVLDASGVYHRPNWAGDGGIPARSELALAPQMTYHLPDVTGAARLRFAGRRTIVVGGGASAATTIAAIAALADEVPGTGAVWATRAATALLLPEIAGDPLPARRELFARARALAAGAHAAVSHVGGAVVEGLEFNSATHRYRVALRVGEGTQVEEVDEVVVHNGYGPDTSITRELQVHECWATAAPMKLATALRAASGATGGDCMQAPATGPEALEHPEPDFYVLGNKSYGRASTFLLDAGFRQAEQVVDALAQRTLTAAPDRGA